MKLSLSDQGRAALHGVAERYANGLRDDEAFGVVVECVEVIMEREAALAAAKAAEVVDR